MDAALKKQKVAHPPVFVFDETKRVEKPYNSLEIAGLKAIIK